MLRQCRASVPKAATECGDSVDCLRRRLEHYEQHEQVDRVRTSMCLSSARRCPRNTTAVTARAEACAARLFDPARDTFDIVVLWTNLSESGYYSKRGASFFSSLEKLRHPYANSSSRRPPFSEIVFGLRSLAKWGMMERVGRVFILYDDDLHGPPAFVAGSQDRVVPLPASLLFAGSPFVRQRRRLHVILSRLHLIPNLSEFVMFMPDDCVMMRAMKWEDVLHPVTGRILSRLAPMAASKPLALSLQRLLQRHFGVKFFQVGTDLHAPFLLKRCYLEEMEAHFCEELYRCDESERYDVCSFKNFHFQQFSQNYQAMREGHAVTRRPRGGFKNGLAAMRRWMGEIHTNGRPVQAVLAVRLAAMEKSGVLWLNLQGNGISDDYPVDVQLRDIVDRFYFSRFGKAGFWELPGAMPDYRPPPLEKPRRKKKKAK